MEYPLVFKHQSEAPTIRGKYLLFNLCDGYHFADAFFDENGKFVSFYSVDFAGPIFDADFYVAWALLPSIFTLYGIFADKPTQDQSANEVTEERLAKQSLDASKKVE